MSDPEDDDVLAAEYVLGTLDSQERAHVQRLIDNDTDLRRKVLAWEDRLAPLLDLYVDVAAPPHLLRSVMAQLDRLAGAATVLAPPQVVALRRSIRRWRFATASLAAFAAALVAWIMIMPRNEAQGRFVAVLQKDPASPAVLLDVDVPARRAIIREVSSDRPMDKSYELWLINPEVGAPRSLGVLRAPGVTKASLQAYDPAVIARSTYAITLEPLGGSPTGVPSGPPILTGKLVDRGS